MYITTILLTCILLFTSIAGSKCSGGTTTDPNGNVTVSLTPGQKVIRLLKASSPLLSSFHFSSSKLNLAKGLFNDAISVATALESGQITFEAASEALRKISEGETVGQLGEKFQSRFQQIVGSGLLVLTAFSDSADGVTVDVNAEISKLEQLMKPIE